MMRETVRIGTAKQAQIPPWMPAGKTGTSQDFRDAWFVGYTAHLVTGVWIGNDDASPTKKATGGGLPVDIWTRFMRSAHQGVAVASLPGLSNGPTLAAAGLPAIAPIPPAAIGGRSAPPPPPPPSSTSLDGWLIDKLFGRH
jgi:penicillin-binding protein 1A